jgi:hypothetical protein
MCYTVAAVEDQVPLKVLQRKHLHSPEDGISIRSHLAHLRLGGQQLERLSRGMQEAKRDFLALLAYENEVFQ